jgi:hypothetical protein
MTSTGFTGHATSAGAEGAAGVVGAGAAGAGVAAHAESTPSERTRAVIKDIALNFIVGLLFVYIYSSYKESL